MTMTIAEIAKIIGAQSAHENLEQPISTLVYDSRKAVGEMDELFIALPGKHRDGHDFVPHLLQLGVRNFLIGLGYEEADLSGCNVLRVPDPLVALQSLAAHQRSAFAKPVIGITGSNGKTIMKEWLASILERELNVLKSPKSYNSQLGVPISLWPLNETHDVAVLEAGISRSGEMAQIEQMIRPTIGVFTNIGEAHAEGFESMSEKISEKAQLFQQSQHVVCNVDHRLIVAMLKDQGIKPLTWGINNEQADVNIHQQGQQYQFKWSGHTYALKVPFKNALDLENIFHAIIVSADLGINPQSIQEAIEKLRPVPMRLELKKGKNHTYILDDSYNNDLLGLEIALDYMLQQPHKQQKTVILSDILQSGKDAEKLYSQVNRLLEKHQISRLIGVGPQINACSACFSMKFSGYANALDLIRKAPPFAEETILVKGARDFELERVVAYLEERNHGTVLEVNFESILHNLKVYQDHLNSDTKLMVMVKAFAYGVGVEEIAHLLQYHKVDYLGVAYLDEAINLRKKGINLPIMIMNVDWDSFGLLETFELEPEIYSLPMLRKYLEDTKKSSAIHLKIETGMNRLGFLPEEIPQLLAVLRANPQLKVAGIFTHFSSADMPQEDDFTREQADIFDKVYDQIVTALGYSPVKHALNSAGIVRWPQYQFDMVRLGIGLYGFDSAGQVKNLRPISELKTSISQIKTVQAGGSVGYARKGKVERESRIATIAIGYADGYSRLFSKGNAYVMVNGQKARTIGNVCMDMTMIDVTGLNVAEGDEVIVFGEAPTIVDLAKWAYTIPYEILTNVSQRVKRVFVSE